MKLTALTLAAVIGLSTAAAPSSSITSDSSLGQKLLSNARRLDGSSSDYSWVANYSLKFLGCHTTPQWNDEADGENGVKLTNLNMVRFRLCPSNTCSSDNAYGCKEGYGDYIIDMNTYLETYLDAAYDCQYALKNECGCYNDESDYSTFEKCSYDCLMNRGMGHCVYNNPYADKNNNNGWDLKDMVQCQQLSGDYYTGTYCSSDGGSIVMGVFTDDTCSNLADVYGGHETYTAVTGKELPHYKKTLVGNECMLCKDYQQDADAVKEGCEMLYEKAGKCEQNMNGGSGDSNACQYMKGLSVVYKESGLFHHDTSATSAASVFIGLFGCSFVLISSYAYYLKAKLDRAKVQLVDEQFLG
jgi:hypothetical protein